ncbi:MAG: YciI family protein [Owenweeksia sp.]
MIRAILLTGAIFFGLTGLSAQGLEIDDEGFQTFKSQEGDTVYTMKKYHIVFLKAGPNRNQDAKEVAEIQKEHLAHINWMAEEGYVDLAGPFAEEGDIRGILIMHVPTLEKAQELASMDPAVKAGRLEVEVHGWWAAEGACLK